MRELAIVGMGSWGLCALERIIGRARACPQVLPLTVHVVEPGPPGSGVYSVDQPDYLLMNTPCGQISLYPWAGEEPPLRGAIGLLEWVTWRGYRWEDGHCVVGGNGPVVVGDDFLPRRVMGEYLQWFYAALVAAAPSELEVVPHRTAAVDMVSTRSGREQLYLADGSTVEVDHVILTTGHTENEGQLDGRGTGHLRPYPVDQVLAGAVPGAAVAVSGFGLVGMDVMAALSVGLGGRFVEQGGRMTYHPSGREPVIHLYSRSGLPYCAKPVAGVDATGDYELGICRPDTVRALRGLESDRSPKRPVDLRRELLPLVLAEMAVRYYAQSEQLVNGAAAGEVTRRRLTNAWRYGQFEPEVEALAERLGLFNPAEHFFGPRIDSYTSGKDYEAEVYARVEADLDEALVPGGASPVKAAYEVLRFLRDPMRRVIEFGGLSFASYQDFQHNLRNHVNRLIAGPPVVRSQQLLALMDAGVVRTLLGPHPTVLGGGAEPLELHSVALDQPEQMRADLLVRGHLEEPTIERSASPLLRNLREQGRIAQFQYGEVPVGSIALSEEFHPLGLDGKVVKTLSVFGALTEGVRYFTHYVPSPKSRLRVFLDVEACVAALLG